DGRYEPRLPHRDRRDALDIRLVRWRDRAVLRIRDRAEGHWQCSRTPPAPRSAAWAPLWQSHLDRRLILRHRDRAESVERRQPPLRIRARRLLAPLTLARTASAARSASGEHLGAPDIAQHRSTASGRLPTRDHASGLRMLTAA